MAGDWIKMRVALTYDLKVMQIAQTMGRDSYFLEQLAPGCQVPTGACNAHLLHTLVIGALHRFWCAAQEVTADGKLGSLTLDDIDALVGCVGFAVTLLEVGWLEEDENEQLQVHNWHEHNGESAKKRAMAGKRVQKCRKMKRAGVTSEPATVTPEALPEKRREEKSKKTPPNPPSGGDADSADAFDAFWSAYPKKVGKGAARSAWARVRPGKELAARIVEAVNAQRSCEQWSRENGRFVPNPATWLNQRRWEDEPAACVNGKHSRIDELFADLDGGDA